MNKINLNEKLSLFNEHWQPKIVGEVNDCAIKLVKFKGEFVWHYHKDEDEMFFVLKGNFIMRFRDKQIELSEGEFLIVPKGVEHQPFAKNEVAVMLIEPKTTLNTGNVLNERTVSELENLDERMINAFSQKIL